MGGSPPLSDPERENLADFLEKEQKLRKDQGKPVSDYLKGAEAVNNACLENRIPLTKGLEEKIKDSAVRMRSDEQSDLGAFGEEGALHVKNTLGYLRERKFAEATASAGGAFLNTGAAFGAANKRWHGMKTGKGN